MTLQPCTQVSRRLRVTEPMLRLVCVFVLRVCVQRVGTFLCVLFEFPLLERPFRLTSLQLLGIDVEPGTQQWTASAAASVTLLCGVAALNVPLDLISALSGSTGGALLIYVAPALMAIRLIQSGGASAGAAGAAESAPARVALLWTLAAVGLALGVIGTLDALAGAA